MEHSAVVRLRRGLAATCAVAAVGVSAVPNAVAISSRATVGAHNKPAAVGDQCLVGHFVTEASQFATVFDPKHSQSLPFTLMHGWAGATITTTRSGATSINWNHADLAHGVHKKQPLYEAIVGTETGRLRGDKARHRLTFSHIQAHGVVNTIYYAGRVVIRASTRDEPAEVSHYRCSVASYTDEFQTADRE